MIFKILVYTYNFVAIVGILICLYALFELCKWNRKSSKKRKAPRSCRGCNKPMSKNEGVRFSGFDYCSENCMSEVFKSMTTEELIEQHERDKKENGYG